MGGLIWGVRRHCTRDRERSLFGSHSFYLFSQVEVGLCDRDQMFGAL